jgi:F-type H+-transporting ATPase subunit alpha
MLSQLRSSDAGILDAIRNDREIKPATEEKLKTFLDAFSRNFA